ncbi:hypothetical protein [Paenibacillus ferrarius]|uniref:hypothetical protein n=1 Tax=Paenibacillus ferrarius TaxID=1469647 RepID=UPI003D2802E3
MDSAFSDINHIFQNGISFILKLLILYIILPECLGVIVLGGILRIRGRLLSVFLVAIAMIGFYLFSIYGLPELTRADFTK